MVFEHIEELQEQYTDKFVIVDESRPELRRFRGMTGVVKTVNMNGRALVEFEAENNIAWFDIDPRFLKVIDRPLPKPEPKPAHKEPKPAAEKPKAKPPAKAAAKPAAGSGKLSTADILAAARKADSGASNNSGAHTEPKPPAKDARKMSVAEIMEAARSQKGATSGEAKPKQAGGSPASEPSKAKLDPKKMTVEQILAAARAEKAGGSAPPPPAAPVQTETLDEPPVEDVADETAQEEAVDEVQEQPAAEETSSTEAPATAQPPSRDQLPKDVEGIIAYCRKVDAS